MKKWIVRSALPTVLAVLTAVAVVFTTCRITRADDPGAKLKAFVERYIAWRFAEYPEWATAMGVHKYDGKLPDMSAAAVERRAAESQRFAAELEAINPSELVTGDRVDREILLNQLELDHFLDTELRSWRHDPLLYTNIASDSVYDLLKRNFAPLEDRLRSAISRMRALPGLLEQARANLDSPPRIKTEIAISQTDGAIGLFRVMVNGAARETAVAAEVAEAAKAAASALKAYRDWLFHDLLPRSRDEWRLGAELYDRLFGLESGSKLSSIEALARAESDYEATLKRMRAVVRENWSTFNSTGKAPADPDEAVRAAIEAMADSHPAPEAFIPSLEHAAADLKRFIREKNILNLPEPDRLSIKPTPDFQAGLFHGQLDQPPALEKDGESIYTTSGSRPYPGPDSKGDLIGFLREFNSKALVGLIIHEGYPGHYVQGWYAARCPSLVRKIFADGAYVEGWACYCEWMMLHEGFGGGDPGLELQMLKGQLKLFGNAILDIKLHRGLMREEEVVPFLVERSFQTLGEAKAKLIRAKGTVIQLSTYFLGYTAMRDLRRDYEAQTGGRFSLAEFHHKVLEAGAPPMRLLRELVLAAAKK
jgi:uncharacterized protein (DUF885 family)